MFSRRRVRKAFATWNAQTKEEIALVIADRFPELALQLPPHRKCYMSEDLRMSIFDAAALAVALTATRRSAPHTSTDRPINNMLSLDGVGTTL